MSGDATTGPPTLPQNAYPIENRVLGDTMTLPDVAQGDPHVAAHNDERELINALQTLTDETFVDGIDARYFLKTGVLDNLATVSYWAHRGGGRVGQGFAPEESLESFRIAAACGVDGLEMDV